MTAAITSAASSMIVLFERQLRVLQRDLAHAQVLDYRLHEKTAAGERDVTDEHLDRLRTLIEQYEEAIAVLQKAT